VRPCFRKNTDLERFKKSKSYSRYMQQLEEQVWGGAVSFYNFNVITIESCKIRRLCYRQGMRNVIWKNE